MAFCGHPAFYRRQAPYASHPHPTYNFYNGPTQSYPSHPFEYRPSPDDSRTGPYTTGGEADYEAEERAALAHLRSIQQRREQAQASAAREASIRAKVQAEREAAIRAAIEREVAKEAAARHAVAVERERKRLAIEHERRRRAEIDQKRREWVQAVIGEKRRKWEEGMKRRNACMRRFTESVEKKEETTDGLDEITKVLGALFGVHVPSDAEKPVERKDEKAETTKVTDNAPQAAGADSMSIPPAPSTSTESSSKETKESAQPNGVQPFPSEINTLLSQFLGLRVEPAGKDDKLAAEFAGVPQGLNEFLGRFGMTFEPDQVKVDTSAALAKAKEAATEPAPHARPTAQTSELPSAQATSLPIVAPSDKADRTTPITSFLSEVTDIPPFFRDILSNVELAWTEGNGDIPKNDKKAEHVGKGKAVAEGKKANPSPAPTGLFEPPAPSAPTPAESTETTDSTASIDKLKDISHELHLATASFTFPDRLAFASPSSPSAEVTPPLLFNKPNSGYHAQAHKLLQLLLAADGIASAGDREVRKERKRVVKAVEGAIEALEQKRDAVWREVTGRRDKGEESEDDETTSSGSSVSADVEDGDPDEQGVQQPEPPVEKETSSFDDPDQSSKDVKPIAEVNAASDQGINEQVIETKADTTSGVEDKAEDKDKEEGYELL